MNRTVKKNYSGQAATEYVLIAAVIISIMIGMNKLFYTAIHGYYYKIADIRAGMTGMFP